MGLQGKLPYEIIDVSAKGLNSIFKLDKDGIKLL